MLFFLELSPGKNSIIGCTPSEFTLLQPATAQHYYAGSNNLINSQAGNNGNQINTSNLLAVTTNNNGSSTILSTAAALVDENVAMNSSVTLTPTSSLDYQGKINSNELVNFNYTFFILSIHS